MTKAFKIRRQTVGAGTAQTLEDRHDTVMVGAGEVQNHDGTYAMDVIPANLAHHGLRSNQFQAVRMATVANTWIDAIELRPGVPFRSFKRIRNVATGAANPSTSILDLNNGTGAAAAGDVFVITWVHVGDLNDNLSEVVLWLRRTAVGGSGNSTIRLALTNMTALANAATGAILALGAGGHTAVPVALDPLNYFTAAAAFAEIRCDAIPVVGNGAPMAFPIHYNSHGVQAVSLVPGNVYALYLYLNQDNVADTDTFELFGSETAIQDPTSECYFGAAGWTGVIAADATMLSPYMILSKTTDAVINQIHVHADAGNTLGGSAIASASVVPDVDAVCDNIPSGGVQWKRELVHNLQLTDMQQHACIFEGKSVVPRRYFIKLDAVCGYTGTVIVEINFWANPEGTLNAPTTMLNA